MEDFYREIDPVELPEECIFCTSYEECERGYVCGVLLAEYTEEEIKQMTDDEFKKKFCKKPNDTCDNFERWED